MQRFDVLKLMGIVGDVEVDRSELLQSMVAHEVYGVVDGPNEDPNVFYNHSIVSLVREGYLTENGNISLTEKGREKLVELQ